MKMQEISSDRIINGRITEGAYAEDESLTSIIIPEGVTDIGEVSFYGCPNLRHVSFPSTLRYIREEAFGESAVESVILPDGLELIEEKAFFMCDSLRKIEVPGRDTVIGSDAFACCDSLTEGYIACGYPENIRHHERLQYTLLWCSCPERHSSETSALAEGFIRDNEELVMEWIIRHNNIPAMSGISKLSLLRGDTGKYITQAGEAGRSEIMALLMSAPRHFEEGEFEL